MTRMNVVARAITIAVASWLGGCAFPGGATPPDANADAAPTDAADSGTTLQDVVVATDASDDVNWPDTGYNDASWPDAGGLAPPDWVPITIGPVGSCAPLTPCGGNIVGTWDTNGACMEVDLESVLSQCPGAMVTRRTARGRGRVVFGADGFGHRVADAEGEIDFFIPAICARYYSCGSIQSASAALVTEATCTTEATGDCSCVARQITHMDEADFYTTANNEIVSRSSGKRWAYCVSGTALTYRDTSPTGPREPGITELRSR